MRRIHNPPAGFYTPDDLHWLREETRLTHLEFDPWGSLIAFPTDDTHELAVAELARQAGLALPHVVSVNQLAWTVPGGTGYVMTPDLLVLARGWQRMYELHFDPPPLLVVEVASRSSRYVDRTRKMTDYRLGGAGLYLLVDLPDPSTGGTSPATFEAHDFATGSVVTATGSIDLIVGGQPIQFSLAPG